MPPLTKPPHFTYDYGARPLFDVIMSMKYKVLVDYYSEGFKFEDKEFNSVNEAVHHAVSHVVSSPWLIVTIVPWRAEGEWQ